MKPSRLGQENPIYNNFLQSAIFALIVSNKSCIFFILRPILAKIRKEYF